MPFVRQNRSPHTIQHYKRDVLPGEIYGNYAGYHFIASPVFSNGRLHITAKKSGSRYEQWGKCACRDDYLAILAFIMENFHHGKVQLRKPQHIDFAAKVEADKRTQEARELREAAENKEGVIRKHRRKVSRSFNSDHIHSASPEYLQASARLYKGVSVEFRRKHGYNGRSCASKSICDYIEGVK